ncbi:MAG TPA: hypothetical protein VIY53_12265 [Acidobacteriaceae bacterium]
MRPVFLRKPRRTHPLLTCAACPALLLLAPGIRSQTQPPPPADTTALIRQAVANRFAENSTHHPLRFVLHKQDDRHNITQQIIETPQGDVALLIAVNGIPISAAGRAAERNRLAVLDAHPEIQAHRQKREQADSSRVDSLLRMLPDAFLYTYQDTVPCYVGTPPALPIPGPPQPAQSAPQPETHCFHLTFQPNPHWDPPSLEAKILRGMAGEIWIQAADDRLYKLSARLIDDVDFGWGIVGRLDKGGTIDLEQTRIAEHDWELTRMKLSLTGKALMVKPLSYHINEELSHFAPAPPATDYHQAIRILEASQPGAK